jgi:hypothetical protein
MLIEAVIAADGYVALVIKLLDSTQLLLLPVFNVFEVHVALQLSVYLLLAHHQLLPIVKGLNRLSLHSCQALS